MQKARIVSKLFSLVVLATFSASPAAALGTVTTEDLTARFSIEEVAALDVLAVADAELRDAVLEASLYPSALDEIAAIQVRSSQRFRARIARLPRSEQEDLWELARYPDYLEALTSSGHLSRHELERIGETVPERVRDIGERTVQRRLDLLREIAEIRSSAEASTHDLLAGMSWHAQATFERLIARPELMSQLASNPGLVARLGELYRDHPEETRATFARQSIEVASRNDQLVEDWRRIIEDDPETARELLDSARIFADEQGYELLAADQPVTVSTVEVHHYYNYSYPYWFGYPSWYVGAFWYPRPHSYHWGFGFNALGGLAVIGLPSPTFLSWHFGHARHADHYTRYSRLHRHWVDHAGRHDRWHGTAPRIVRRWAHESGHHDRAGPSRRAHHSNDDRLARHDRGKQHHQALHGTPHKAEQGKLRVERGRDPVRWPKRRHQRRHDRRRELRNDEGHANVRVRDVVPPTESPAEPVADRRERRQSAAAAQTEAGAGEKGERRRARKSKHGESDELDSTGSRVGSRREGRSVGGSRRNSVSPARKHAFGKHGSRKRASGRPSRRHAD